MVDQINHHLYRKTGLLLLLQTCAKGYELLGRNGAARVIESGGLEIRPILFNALILNDIII